jgi:hypothetical protein
VETNQNGYIMETADMRRGVKQQLTQIWDKLHGILS